MGIFQKAGGALSRCLSRNTSRPLQRRASLVAAAALSVLSGCGGVEPPQISSMNGGGFKSAEWPLCTFVGDPKTADYFKTKQQTIKCLEHEALFIADGFNISMHDSPVLHLCFSDLKDHPSLAIIFYPSEEKGVEIKGFQSLQLEYFGNFFGKDVKLSLFGKGSKGESVVLTAGFTPPAYDPAWGPNLFIRQKFSLAGLSELKRLRLEVPHDQVNGLLRIISMKLVIAAPGDCPTSRIEAGKEPFCLPGQTGK